MLRRLRYWIESAKRSEALREEMELHLAEKAAELQADGMTAERARSEARRRFGNVGLKHEESREIWMTRFLSGAPQQRKSPVGEGPTQGGCWLNLVACERPSRETGQGEASR